MSKIASIAALLIGAAGANGAMCVLTQGPYSQGVGGEFNANLTGAPFSPIALTGSGLFETFCLERAENFTPGHAYTATFSTFAVGGAGGAVGGMDPLDERTAYLYANFISGTLPYDYGDAVIGRANNAGGLQNAIWFLEQEINDISGDAVAQFYVNLSAAGVGMGLGDVRVMNLFEFDGNGEQVNAQSQLIMIPTPGALAPAGLGALAMVRRRR